MGLNLIVVGPSHADAQLCGSPLLPPKEDLRGKGLREARTSREQSPAYRRDGPQ